MRVCVIKVNQLGDSVVGLPMVGELVDAFGRESVFIITTPIAAGLYSELVPAQNLLVMERAIFNSAWKRPLVFVKIWSFLFRARLDALFNPFDQGNLARLVGSLVPCKMRFSMSNPQVRFNGFGYSVVPFEESLSMHENNWKLFRESAKRIGIEKPKVLPASPLKYLPGDDGIVTENDDSCSDGRRVLIHPGSSRATTQWEYSRFVLLANRLSSDGYSVTWMLEGERPAGLTAEVDALPRDSLENFVRKLRDFDLFVGNNSGPMHLADVVGLRLVIIPGPAAVGWDPYWAKVIRMLRVEGLACQPCEVLGQLKPSCRLTSEPHACQGRIRVEDVYSTILALGRGRV